MATTYKTLNQVVVGSTRTFAAVSNKVITSNVATITTAAAHGFSVGDIVTIAGVDTIHDGTWAIASIPLTTTFTYLSTTSTQSTAAVTPNATVVRTHNLGGVVSANKFSTGANAIFTAGSAHSLSVNDWVRVTVGDASMNGLVKVISTPSTTTFSYALAGSSVASTAVSTGAFGRAIPSTWTSLYTPSGSTTAVVSSISVANGTTASAQYRIALTAASSPYTPSQSEILVYDATVAANDTVTLTLGLTITNGLRLVVNANSPEITFAAFGSENS
jgi:hypothetical protein